MRVIVVASFARNGDWMDVVGRPVAPDAEEFPVPYAALRIPMRLLTELLLDDEESDVLAFVPRLEFGPNRAETKLN
jgi:hypothetical protein